MDATSSGQVTYLNSAAAAEQPKKAHAIAQPSKVVYLNEVKPKHHLQQEHHTQYDDYMLDLFHSLTHANYLGQQVPTCKVYTTMEVFWYNFIFWNLSFILGLNFTHLDNGPMKRLTLDPNVMKTWGKGMWALFAVMVALMASILYENAMNLVKMQKLHVYVAWGIALYGWIKWNTKRQPEKTIHVHHYDVALILMSFMSVQTPWLSMVHAFCHGFFIEGGCRWGFDPMWQVENNSEAKQANEISKEVSADSDLKKRSGFDSELSYGAPAQAYPVVLAPAMTGEPMFGNAVMPAQKQQQQLPNELLSLLTPK